MNTDREEKKKKLIACLTKNVLEKGEAAADWENGTFAEEILYQANAFGSGPEPLLEEMFSEENGEALYRNFKILFSAYAIFESAYWKREEENSCNPHWDLRIRESRNFCHQNDETFRKIFKEAAGVEFPASDDLAYCRKWERELSKFPGLTKEVYELVNAHPTLVQTMIGIGCRLLSERENYPDFDRGFPFV